LYDCINDIKLQNTYESYSIDKKKVSSATATVSESYE